MSKYRITMDGKTYEMEIELVSEKDALQHIAKKETAEVRNAPKAPADNAAPAEQKQPVNNAGTVTAPMPGTVIMIGKKEGQVVKAGEVVLILEAMKMENEIVAPADGTITAMYCAVGGTVASGDALFEVK